MNVIVFDEGCDFDNTHGIACPGRQPDEASDKRITGIVVHGLALVVQEIVKYLFMKAVGTGK